MGNQILQAFHSLLKPLHVYVSLHSPSFHFLLFANFDPTIPAMSGPMMIPASPTVPSGIGIPVKNEITQITIPIPNVTSRHTLVQLIGPS